MEYTISDVAKIFGVTPSALRFIEKEGVLTVARDGSDRRSYSVMDVFKFLTYTKYRSMGIPMKKIANHLGGIDSTFPQIHRQLVEQKLEAQKQAAHYTELAAAIEEHIISAERIETLLGQYEFVQSPHMLIMHDQECGWISKNKKAHSIIQKWIQGMPVTKLAVILHDADTNTAGFGYSVSPEQAKRLSLPMELSVLELSPTSCLHTIVTTSEDFAFVETPHIIFEEAVAYAKSRGFTVNGKPWGHILLVEQPAPETPCPYMEIWIPIK